MTPTIVFICHRQILDNPDGGTIFNEKAHLLAKILNERPNCYDAWIDQASVRTGAEWESAIYEALINSDVLLVAVTRSTSKSEWVRREIAFAKALGIGILPLGYDIDSKDFVEELKLLGIDKLQGRLTTFLNEDTKAKFLEEIQDDIRLVRESTAIDQRRVLDRLNMRRSPIMLKAEDNVRASSFSLRLKNGNTRVHVAAGDLTTCRDVDILVNSENDYMQMARIFESRTVSSLLRQKGASRIAGRYVDTIQIELDEQLRDCSRPVQPAEVFVTSAGGPDSVLSNNGVRYIFHVAAVQAVTAQAKVVPFGEPHQIGQCVISCLGKMAKLNESLRQAGGSISVTQSILFPLFGTGQGGRHCADAIGPILRGITEFFSGGRSDVLLKDLRDVYIAAYSQEHLEVVTKALSNLEGAKRLANSKA